MRRKNSLHHEVLSELIIVTIKAGLKSGEEEIVTINSDLHAEFYEEGEEIQQQMLEFRQGLLEQYSGNLTKRSVKQWNKRCEPSAMAL